MREPQSWDIPVLSHREVLARIFEAMESTGEPDWSLVLPGFEIHDPELLDSVSHRGRDGWREWSENWTRVFPDYSMERVDQIGVDADRILTVHRLRARGGASGVEVTRTDAQLWSFEDGRLARMDYLPDYDPADQSWAVPGGPRRQL
jgi:ketosteroid isomerase-like protein